MNYDFNTVWDCVMKIMIFIIACSGWKLIGDMSKYFKALKEKAESDKNYNLELINKANTETKLAKYSIEDNVNGGQEIINLIITLISIEISSRLNALKLLNDKYDLKNLDADAKEIANSVYESLNKDMLVNAQSAVTPEYLLSFITSETSSLFISSVIDHNSSIFS